MKKEKSFIDVCMECGDVVVGGNVYMFGCWLKEAVRAFELDYKKEQIEKLRLYMWNVQNERMF